MANNPVVGTVNLYLDFVIMKAKKVTMTFGAVRQKRKQ